MPSAEPMNRRNRSLVIGAGGSIGGTLLTRLTREGVDVQGTCRAKFPPAGCLHLELTDEPRLWLLPDSIGAAYLCAGISPQEACRQDPYGTRLVNVLRTVELAKRLAANGTFVVFLSSSWFLTVRRPTAVLCAASPRKRNTAGRRPRPSVKSCRCRGPPLFG